MCDRRSLTWGVELELPSGGEVDVRSSPGRTWASRLLRDVSGDTTFTGVDSQINHPVAHPGCRLAIHGVSKRFEFVFEPAGRKAM